MSKLPILMIGTQGFYDYIMLAVKGNIGLGVKVVDERLVHGEIAMTFRIRAAVHTDSFIERITGSPPTEKYLPYEAFPGSWSKKDDYRSSLVHNTKKAVSMELMDDGSWPTWSELGENLTRMIGTIFDFVQIPEDAIITTPSEDFAEHIAKLMYPQFMIAYGVAAQAKYGDSPASHTVPGAKGEPMGISSFGGASLEEAAQDLMEGGPEDEADDEADEVADDEADDEAADHEPEEVPDDDEEDKVTPFPGA